MSPISAVLAAGEEVDSIDYWAGQVRQLEHEIVDARRRALEAPPCASFFVFFKTQKDAAVAAQTNIHPEDGRSFRVVEAPGPEEVTHCCRPPALKILASLSGTPSLVLTPLSTNQHSHGYDCSFHSTKPRGHKAGPAAQCALGRCETATWCTV